MTLIEIMETYARMLKDGKSREVANRWLIDIGINKEVFVAVVGGICQDGSYLRRS